MGEKTKVVLVNMVAAEQYPPLSIACLAAYANKFDEISGKYEIILLSTTVKESDIEKIIGDILLHNPAIIGFSCYIWNLMFYIHVIPVIRKKLESALILLGGPEVYPELLHIIPGADAVIMGEGELAFKELLEKHMRGLPWDGVRGIAVRSGEGIRTNPQQPLIENLDEIPSPYLTGLLKPGESKRVEYNRGCRYKCSFCSHSNVPFRHYSLKRIEEEIADCVSKGQRIHFAVGTYLNSGEFGRNVLRLVLEYQRKHGLVIEGNMFVDGNRDDPEFFELLAKTAANKRPSPVEIGIQCCDRKSLKLNRRTNNFRVIGKNMELLKRLKIPVFMDILIGMPGDNLLRFAQSLATVADFQPTFMPMGMLRQIPNTAIFRENERFRIRADALPPRIVNETISSSPGELRKTMLLAQSFSVEYHAVNRPAGDKI